MRPVTSVCYFVVKLFLLSSLFSLISSNTISVFFFQLIQLNVSIEITFIAIGVRAVSHLYIELSYDVFLSVA